MKHCKEDEKNYCVDAVRNHTHAINYKMLKVPCQNLTKKSIEDGHR